ncbi:hypothetical protein [Kitasatospora sp. DSM 101779]|uniref:hypothetical protein n=1 Tax=Kitasatospora sp. DSM 101779 TaxID=2853165 RepID=UPI0021DA190C|nr:hypothetical protein [Kitasatospora sp. DSM 101779]MCU7820873.1 hypothetical protein [Kitasatospora sp. DSM 101779]
MGLSITVGLLDDLDRHDPEVAAHHARELAVLAEALQVKGIDWREPAASGSGHAAHSGGFPYGYLHHLRRAYVLHRHGAAVTPAATTDPEQYDCDRGEVEEETLMFSSHLLCHSDCAGYYVPADFEDPVFLPEDAAVAGGGMVGSTGRLLAELRRTAPAIGICPDAAAAVDGPADADAPADDPYEAEKFAWYVLHGACRASLATGRAIVFH